VLKASVAGFTGPGALRELNREFHDLAARTSRSLLVKAPVTDSQLLALLGTHPGLRDLTLGACAFLTPAGIRKAFDQNPSLQAIDATLCPGFTLDVARALGATHPGLTRLSARGDVVSEEVLARFGDRLTHLEVRGPFRGERLPDSLRVLAVTDSPTFTGEQLPPGLEQLRVSECQGFTGRLAQPALRALTITRCPRVTSDLLAAIGRTHPGLAALTTDVPIRVEALAVFADRMSSLALWNGLALEKAAFQEFTNLGHLVIHNCDVFTGANLPASLHTLEVDGCRWFRSEHLASSRVHQLRVNLCPHFTGLGLGAHLTDVSIRSCPGCTPGHLGILLGHLPGLQTLAYRDWGQGEVDPALFASHPRLQTVTIRRERKGPETAWRRPAAPLDGRDPP